MTAPSHDPLRQAILHTLAYADIFDYALTTDELHRFLIGHSTTPRSVDTAVSALARDGARVVQEHEFLTLSGREQLIDVRRTRRQIAHRQWQKARRYGRLLAHLPFVRMVAVTGALAVENVRECDDIDFFIITSPHRLWTVRALAIAIVRPARLGGDQLCPNFLISEDRLYFGEQNLYSAHEIAQAVPLYGLDVYRQYRILNAWTLDFLPNANGVDHLPVEEPLTPAGSRLKELGEKLLSNRLGQRLEQWEQTRKIAKLRAQIPTDADLSSFTVDCCKGHFHGHEWRVLAKFQERQEALQT